MLLNCGAGEVLQHWQTGSLPLVPPGKPAGSDIRSQGDQGQQCLDPQGHAASPGNEIGGALKAAAESFRGRVQVGRALPYPLLRWQFRGWGGGCRNIMSEKVCLRKATLTPIIPSQGVTLTSPCHVPKVGIWLRLPGSLPGMGQLPSLWAPVVSRGGDLCGK